MKEFLLKNFRNGVLNLTLLRRVSRRPPARWPLGVASPVPKCKEPSTSLQSEISDFRYYISDFLIHPLISDTEYFRYSI